MYPLSGIIWIDMIRFEIKSPIEWQGFYWEKCGIYLSRAEGCKDRVNGWAVGDPKNPDDAKDAEHLYSVLENSVIPTYYNNRNDWILMMKEAIKTSGLHCTQNDNWI